MQRYRWPGYDIQLLGKLQKQQNDAQFCDTLLQAEGISIPTHSCVLAALSPYLSQRLSASPPPFPGQKKQLQLPLHGVGAHTLLKLVGLLYSGQLEVTGSAEQNDVLTAMRLFGITHLIQGQKDGATEKDEDCRARRRSCRKMRDAEVQVKMSERGAVGSPVGRRSCISAGTQTVEANEEKTGNSFTHKVQTKPPNPLDPVSSAAPSLEFPPSLQLQQIPLDSGFRSTSFPTTPSMPSGASSSDGESTLDISSDSLTKPTSTSALPSNVMNFPISLNDELDLLRPQQDKTYQSEREANGEKDTVEWPGLAKPNQTPGDEQGKRMDNRRTLAHVGVKSLAKIKRMQQMMESTQISIKVKLRRRTKGQAWKVVSIRDRDDALSVFNSLQQDSSNHKKPKTVQTCSEPPPSSVHKPQSPIGYPSTTNSSDPPPQPNTSCELLSSDCFTQSQPEGPQPAGPVEECDEQMEKLLEDIMMGLNILPSLDQSSTDTGIHCCFTAQNQPCFSSLPPARLIQNQQQQSVTYMEQRQRSSHQGMTTAYYSGGHRLNYPACQKRQDDQNALQFLPLTSEHDSPHSLPCMDDLRLPLCLSPLDPSPSVVKHQPGLGNSANKVLLQTSSLGRPWLTKEPVSLQFPFSAITFRPSKSPPLPKNKKRSWSGKKEVNLKLIQKIVESGTSSSSTVEEIGAILAGKNHQKATEGTSDPTKKTGSLECKQGDNKGEAEAPKKRKRTCKSDPQNDARSLLPFKDVKVSNETKSLINLTDCSVSLSSNNVLAKERELAISFTNMQRIWVKKPKTITDSVGVRTKGPGKPGTNQSQIRTRGFVKNTGKSNDTTVQNEPVVKPVACKAQIVDEQGILIPLRKRGRPRKIGPKKFCPESCSTMSEKKDLNVDRELQPDNLSKKRHKKRRRTRSEVEVNPVNKTISSESTGEAAEAERNREISPALKKKKQPRLVCLKEFQKLIKHQHSKRRMSQESQNRETIDSATDVERKVKEPGGGCGELLEFTLPENRKGIFESSSIFHMIVDQNHNQTFYKSAAEHRMPKQDDKKQFTGKVSSFLVKECHSQSSFDVLEEEVTTSVAETKKQVKDLDEVQKVCEAAVSESTQQTVINDEDLSPSDTILPTDYCLPLDHNIDPPTPTRTDPHLEPVRFIKRLSCGQEEEEEEEVDILLYSPDKVLTAAERQGSLHDMDTTPEEEDEDEDVNEIDVTGDEAE